MEPAAVICARKVNRQRNGSQHQLEKLWHKLLRYCAGFNTGNLLERREKCHLQKKQWNKWKLE